MADGRPVVNDGLTYIDGLQLTWASTTTLTVAAGQCRDADNVNDIVLSSAVTINAATNGLNGLDQGALANSTFYAVYAIGSSFNSSLGGAILSTDTSSPLLPSNYDTYRRIGYVLTSGAAAILNFRQTGNGPDRWMFYDVMINELNGGNATAFTDVDMASSVPVGSAKMVKLQCTYTPAAAGRAALIRPDGAVAAEGWVKLQNCAAAAQISMQDILCDSLSVIEYDLENAADALSLDVRGYQDRL